MKRRSHLLATLLGIALGPVLACDSDKGSEDSADGAKSADPSSGEAPAVPTGPAEELDDAALAELLARVQSELEAQGPSPERTAALRQVTEQADDPHLRANASLLLGALAEESGDRRSAISFYTQAREWVPQEPATHAVLALALAAEGEYAKASEVQHALVELTPDDLQAWLIWGEIEAKAGNGDKAAEVYAGYEMRRTGLLDGLTLKKDGAYQASDEDRVVIVENLVAATDNGTALALLYALDSDPSPAVRAALIELMGTQRLVGYRAGLEAQLAAAQDPEMKKLVEWALAEIARDGVESRPGPAPAQALPSDGDDAAEAGEGAADGASPGSAK